MTKPGPRPTPTALKKRRGNPGRRPLPPDEPVVQAVVLRKPRGAGKDHYVSQFYDWFAKALGEAGVTSPLDGTAFYLLANAWKRFKQAETIVDREGTMTLDDQGLPRKHPMIQVERDARKAVLDLLSHFGMSPAERSRIVALGGEEEPDLFEMLGVPYAEG